MQGAAAQREAFPYNLLFFVTARTEQAAKIGKCDPAETCVRTVVLLFLYAVRIKDDRKRA